MEAASKEKQGVAQCVRIQPSAKCEPHLHI